MFNMLSKILDFCGVDNMLAVYFGVDMMFCFDINVEFGVDFEKVLDFVGFSGDLGVDFG